jgi:hypothetical protein
MAVADGRPTPSFMEDARRGVGDGLKKATTTTS